MKKSIRHFFEKSFRTAVFFLFRAFARIAFGTHVHIEGEKPKKGAIVLCSHHTVFDFAFLACAVKPMMPRFVARSLEFERSRLYSRLLNIIGIIPKTQGAMDLVCVRTVINACRAGEIVAIYPSGMTSFDGRPGWEPMHGTGSLVRMAGVDVYTAVESGAFISHPRYTRAAYRGRVDITLRRLFTAEEVVKMKPEDIQKAIVEALDFNEWQTQSELQTRFLCGNSVKKLPILLYTCPDCGARGTMERRGARLVCSVCGMTAVRDHKGFFTAVHGKCPPRMDQWVDLQLEDVRKELENEEHTVTGKASFLEKEQNGMRYLEKGSGTLTLSRDGFTFSGEGETLTWSLKSFQFLILNDVDYLQFNTQSGSFRFVLEDPRLLYRWFFTHRELAAHVT